MNTMIKLILIFPLLFSSAVFADLIAKKIDEMTLDQKIGQMLLVGFRGTEISKNSQIVKDIQNYHIGSVILFDRDVALGSSVRNIQSVEQVERLNRDLQSYSDIPLFVSIDQEGGMVTRLKPQHGFMTTESHEQLGKQDPSYTLQVSQELSLGLDQVGVNLNFAPVVDVNTNPYNPIIARFGRSFSQDPDQVTEHARAFIRGHRVNNVGTVLKHFPGHGSSQADSHIGFTDVTQTWHEKELTPYADLIRQGDIDMVMTAHVFNRNLDPNFPATLSDRVIGGILRQQLGFQGVVISDDMNMGAIKDHFELSESIVLAINAGVDILLFGNNLYFDSEIAGKAHQIIREAVRSGTIDRSRIELSVRRILELKESIGLF